MSDTFSEESRVRERSPAFSQYFKFMLKQGVHLAPSQFEAIFLSDAHTDLEIQEFLELVKKYF